MRAGRGWVGGPGSCGMLQLHQHELAQNSLIVRYLRHKLPTTAVKIVKMGNILAVRVGFLWPINGKVCNACTCNRFVARHVALRLQRHWVLPSCHLSSPPTVKLSSWPLIQSHPFLFIAFPFNSDSVRTNWILCHRFTAAIPNWFNPKLSHILSLFIGNSCLPSRLLQALLLPSLSSWTKLRSVHRLMTFSRTTKSLSATFGPLWKSSAFSVPLSLSLSIAKT